MMSPGLNSNAEPEADPSVSLSLDPAVDSGVASGVNSTVESNPDAWRVEVSARLERYRTRRKPRSPRYPSLLLTLDAPESWSRSAPTPLDPAAATLGSASENFSSRSNRAGNPELYLRDGAVAPAIEYERNAGQQRESSPEPYHELCAQVASSNMP